MNRKLLEEQYKDFRRLQIAKRLVYWFVTLIVMCIAFGMIWEVSR